MSIAEARGQQIKLERGIERLMTKDQIAFLAVGHIPLPINGLSAGRDPEKMHSDPETISDFLS